jgi:hypoxanthine-DNA glycosylase
MRKKNLYISLWNKELEHIIQAIKAGGRQWQLNSSDFNCLGQRDKYNFCLDYNSGESKESGSAVGRDLQIVLRESSKFKELVKDKNLTIKMGKDFVLHVIKYDNNGSEPQETEAQEEKDIEIDNLNDEGQNSEENFNVEGFLPIDDEESEILILGTAPGKKSLERGEYYADNTNVFWKLLSEFFNDGIPFLNYQQKKDCLHANHIAVWDVCKSCVRSNSSDDEIKNPVLNDLQSFVKRHSKLKKIAFNGNKAQTQGMPLVRTFMNEPYRLKIYSLVSTSGSANGQSEKRKRQWRNVFDAEE